MSTLEFEYCLVFEYVPCNLLETITSRLSEIESDEWYKKVVGFTRDLVTGLKHLHDNNVLHRDIKPENLLITRSDTLKICDFGMSCALTDAEAGKCGVYVGPRSYRAPELLKHAQNLEVKHWQDMDDTNDDHDCTQTQKQEHYICSASKGFREYSYPIDVWAVGCIVFEMLTGDIAFPALDSRRVLECISKSLSQNRVENELKGRPSECIQFVKTCLQMNPNHRPSCSNLLCMEFLRKSS
eukprot:jgi/Botrbrau1/20752/Bobra.0058s0080.1